MKVHAVYVRLNWIWLLLADLSIFFLFPLLPGSILLVIQLFFSGAIYVLSRPFIKRYDYYFMNLGYTPWKLSVKMLTANTLFVSLLFIIFNLIR